MKSFTGKSIHPILEKSPTYIWPGAFTRLFAVTIDWMCFFLSAMLIEILLQSMLGLELAQFGVSSFWVFLFFLLVRVLVVYLYGTTPGLSLNGLRVVNSENLQRPSFTALLTRIPFQFLGFLVFSLYFHRTRMTVYDLICNVAYVPDYVSAMQSADYSPTS